MDRPAPREGGGSRAPACGGGVWGGGVRMDGRTWGESAGRCGPTGRPPPPRPGSAAHGRGADKSRPA